MSIITNGLIEIDNKAIQRYINKEHDMDNWMQTSSILPPINTLVWICFHLDEDVALGYFKGGTNWVYKNGMPMKQPDYWHSYHIPKPPKD